MKNIYLVILIIIALAVFLLGMAIFISQKRSPQTANPQTEITQPQTEGSAGGAAGSPVSLPGGPSTATESATLP